MPKLPAIPPLPPPFDRLGRQIAIGLGKIASRAVVHAAKSVTNDVDRFGKSIRKSAEKTRQKLDKLAPEDDDELDQD